MLCIGLALGCATLGSCEDDDTPCGPGPCVGHSHCVVVDGAEECPCDTGYDGPDCSDCAWGYQDRDGDALCLPACGGAAALTCPINWVCDDSSGEASCACETGYTGPTCEACATGYAPDGTGGCVPTP